MISQISVNEHSSIRIGGEQVIYFDPFRIKEAAFDADIIFITHAHYDHFSPEDIVKIKKDSTVFVMPKSMQGEENKLALSNDKVIFMSPGETVLVGNYSVTAVPSYNTNKPMHPKSNGWLGYVVEISGKKIFVAGDTDITEEAKNVICHIAMVPICGTYTMYAKEAAELINGMKPDVVIPTHYGTLVGKPEDANVFESLVHSTIQVCRKL